MAEVLDRILAAPESDRDRLIREFAEGLPAREREIREWLRITLAEQQASETARSAAPPPIPPSEYGPYRIERLLHRGGMGEVHLAVRSDGIYEQQVAIKRVLGGVMSPYYHLRFDQERRILARLEHPNIARLLDGGLTPAGEPYFVMEYVDGQPVTSYVAEHNLPLRARLRLFCSICEAVSFTHRNLTIHRDLKPGNVFVTREGVVKLLDFGIAKLIGDGSGGEATMTLVRAFTPNYASPEQIRGEAVTTATDIYSLAVLLTEILTGKLPYGASTRIEQFVLESEPEFAGRLDADIEGILRKALAKDPAQRYATVDQFAEDIQRYLDGLPVHARPATFSYRASRFLRRNWRAVAVATLFITGMAAATAWSLRAARIAEEQRARAFSVLEFLKQIVSAADVESTFPVRLRADSTLVDLMDGATKALDTFTRDEQVEAELRMTIGNSYRTLEKWDAAEKQLRRVDAIYKQGSGHTRERINVLRALAQLSFRKGELAAAAETDREALALWDSLGSKADPKEMAGTLAEIATILIQGERNSEALPYLDRAAAIIAAHPGMDPQWVGYVTGVRARAYGAVGDRTKAESLYRESIAIGEKLGWPPPNFLSSNLHNLGMLLRSSNPAEAEQWLNRSLEVKMKTYGAENQMTLSTIVELNLTRARMGKGKEAEQELRKALAIERRILPAGHFEIPRALRSLGETLYRGGQCAEAESLLREALTARRKLYPAGSTTIADTQAELAMALSCQGRRAAALVELEEALAAARKSYPAGHPTLRAMEDKLAQLNAR